jgi:hypothetical protein
MKQFLGIAIFLLATATAFAQAQKDSTVVPKKKDWSKIKLNRLASDHFMVQVGYDNWANKPDTILTTGFSRSFNFYAMYDIPFKSDLRFSVAAGLGFGSSNIFFNQQEVLVNSQNPTLAFPDMQGANHFKKFKLVTNALEIPIELRYALDPEHSNSSWKFALGVKVGTLLTVYTKGKNMVNNAGQTINDYIEKEVSKRYFNSTRLIGTFRVSYGVIGLFGQFQATGLIRPAYGPPVLPFSIGLCLSGL